MRKRVSASFLLATFVVLGLPSLALAASPSYMDDGTIKVEYGDLNIDTVEGAKTLYARMEKAAEIGCDYRPFSEFGSIKHYNDSRACYKEKLTAAVERINSDTLTRIHNSK